LPPETERLRYTRGALEALRRALEERSREELVDLVCHLQKTYVFDQTLPYDIPIPERVSEPEERLPDPLGSDRDASAEQDPQDTPVRRFARLVDGLKRKTGLPQLEGFSIDAEGRAVLIVDNQKVTFGERVTVEFNRARTPTGAIVVPTVDPAPSPPPAPPARGGPAPFEGQGGRPQGRPAASPARPAPKSPPKQARPAPSAAPEDDDNTSGRIGRLELD